MKNGREKRRREVGEKRKREKGKEREKGVEESRVIPFFCLP